MPTLAFVLIKTKVGKTGKVLEDLKQMKEVIECYMVTGVYDIIAKIEAPDLESLGKIVADRMHEMEGVTSTVTCLVIR